MMDSGPMFFIAIGLMVALITIAKAYGDRIKNSKNEQIDAKTKLDGTLEKLESRFERIESRLGNLESIIIEQDKEQRFRDLK